jgi:hypothetical protein
MTIAKAKAFWPLVITASNRNVPYNNGAGNFTAAVATGTYLSAVLLAAAITTALQANLAGSVVSVDATGHFNFNWTGPFTMKWATTTNSMYVILGATAVDVAATGSGINYNVLNTRPHQNGWYAPHAVRKDSLPIRDRAMDTVTLTMSGQTKFSTESELAKRELTFSFLAPEYTYLQYETGVYINTSIENWWANGRTQFRYWGDGTSESAYNDYVFDIETIKAFSPTRMFDKKGLYEINLKLLGYVA